MNEVSKRVGRGRRVAASRAHAPWAVAAYLGLIGHLAIGCVGVVTSGESADDGISQPLERSSLDDQQPVGLEIPNLRHFQTDSFSGNASAVVPFETPSGPGGSGIDAALSYSSMRAADERPGDRQDCVGQTRNRGIKVNAAGRGFSFSEQSFITREALVLGGESHRLVGDGRDQTEDHSNLQIEWRRCNGRSYCYVAHVIDDSGTVWDFGGFEEPGAALDDISRVGWQFHYSCRNNSPRKYAPNACEPGQRHLREELRRWATARVNAISQWTSYGLHNARGAIDPSEDFELRPYRLWLRKRTDRFGNAVHYFYRHNVVNTEFAPYVSETRLERIVWAADPAAMARIEGYYKRLWLEARRVQGDGTIEDVFRQIPDCGDGDTTHPLVDLGNGNSVPCVAWNKAYDDANGQLDGIVQTSGQVGPRDDGYRSNQITTRSALLSLEDMIDDVRRLEMRLEYTSRLDDPTQTFDHEDGSRYEGRWVDNRFAFVTCYEGVAPERLYQLRLMAHDGSQPWSLGGWRLDHGEVAGIPNVRDGMNLARVEPWVGQPSHVLPAMTFGYTPTDASEATRSLLARVDNGYRGTVEYEYADFEQDIRGAVLRQRVRDGEGHVLEREFHRETRFEGDRDLNGHFSGDDDGWFGSRVVVESVRVDGVLEQCNEQRFFTNADGVTTSQPYRFANGTASAYPGAAGELRTPISDGTARGLAGRTYQGVRWAPHGDRCPRPVEQRLRGYGAGGDYRSQQATSPGWGAFGDTRHRFTVSGAGPFVVEPVESRERDLIPDTGLGLAASAAERLIERQFDGRMNATLVRTSIGTSSGWAEMRRTEQTFHPRSVDPSPRYGLPSLLSSRRQWARVPGQGVRIVAEEEVPTYHTVGGALTVQPSRQRVHADGHDTVLPAPCAANNWVSTDFGYDSHGNLISATTAGRGTRTDYDALYHVVPVREVDALGHAVQTYYGFQDNPASCRSTGSPFGNGHHCYFAPTRIVGKFRDGASPSGPVTQHGYDGWGRQVTTTEAGITNRHTVEMPNAERRLRVRSCQISDAEGDHRCNRTEFDGWGRVVESWTAMGGHVRTRYDGQGRIVETERDGEGPRRIEHRMADQSTVALEPDGTFVQACHGRGPAGPDPLGTEVRSGATTDLRPCTETFNGGRVVHRFLNPLGYENAITEYDGMGASGVAATTAMRHDGVGRLWRLIDPAGLETAYEYDLRGNRLTERSPDRGLTEHCFDAHGEEIASRSELSASLDPRPWTMTYDAGGRPLDLRDPDGEAVVHRTYDAQALGLLATVTAIDRGVRTEVSYGYDNYQRLVGERKSVYRHGVVLLDIARRLQIDAHTGDLTCERYDGYGGVAGTLAVGYRHEKASGALRSVGTNACGCDSEMLPVINATGRLHGRIGGVRYPDGSLDVRGYDRLGRTDQVQVFRGDEALLDMSLEYDQQGALRRQEETGIGGPIVREYRYDGRLRLVRYLEDGAVAERYGYEAGNDITYLGDPSAPFTYATASGDPVRRLRSGPGFSLRYGPGGGVIERTGAAGYAVERDGLGRATGITTTSGQWTERFFDHDGLTLVARSSGDRLYGPGAFELDGAIRRLRINGPISQVVVEYDGGDHYQGADQSACGARYCTFLPYVPVGADGPSPTAPPAPPAPPACSGETPRVAIYHADASGQPRVTTGLGLDSGQGDLDLAFTPYGAAIGTGDPAALVAGYGGHSARDAIPVYDFGARLYDPGLGRFLSPDPSWPTPGQAAPETNAYAYARNNPIRYHDPDGRRARPLGALLPPHPQGYQMSLPPWLGKPLALLGGGAYDEASGTYSCDVECQMGQFTQSLGPTPLSVVSTGTNTVGQYGARGVSRRIPIRIDPGGVLPRVRDHAGRLLDNWVGDFAGRAWQFGNRNVQLAKGGLRHILERHAPNTWNGSVTAGFLEGRTPQSFLPEAMGVDEIVGLIDDILRQNSELLREHAFHQNIRGTFEGFLYEIGIRDGQIIHLKPVIDEIPRSNPFWSQLLH